MSSLTTLCAGRTGKGRRKLWIWSPFYVVERLDGDYAQLRRLDKADAPLKSVAHALLSDDVSEGTKLKFELFQHTVEP